MQAKIKFCGLFAAVVTASMVGSPQVSADDRADALLKIEQAQAALKPPSAVDLARALSDAAAMTKTLDAYLKQLPTGEMVRKSVKLDELSAQLLRTPPDLSALTALYEQLYNDQHSSPAQIGLRLALDNSLDYLRALANPGLAEEYKRGLADLADALQADNQQSTPQTRARLLEVFSKLPHYPGARSLRLAVRRAISYPNQMLVASDHFLTEEAARQKLGMVTPINENSSGTMIRGSAETKGKVAIVMHPNNAEAEIEVQFRGLTQSQLTGSKGPVNIFERGHADIDASDVGYLSATNGVRTAPAVANARSDIRPYAVQVNMACRLLRRIVTRIAWKTAWKQKAAGDRQAEQKIETQLQTELARRTKNELQDFNNLFHSFYPITGGEASSAPRLHFSTSSSHMYGGAEFAAPWQMASPSPAPTIPGIDRALLLQVHESAIRNNAGSLAGRTLNEPDFREVVFDTLALTPDEPNRGRGRVPAKVTLTMRQPLDASLQNGLIALVFRINSFQKTGQRYDGNRTVRVNYRPQIGTQGVEVLREGPIGVEPASVADQPDLAALMAEVLPERANTQGPTSTGALGESHDLRVAHLSVADGWLNVAWEHMDSTTAAASKPAAGGPIAKTISTNEVRP